MSKVTVTSILPVLPVFATETLNLKAVRRTMARLRTHGRRNARRVDPKAMKGVLAKKLPTTRTKAVFDFVGA